ncbi:tigger transposable element-derived protein 4-like [Dermacentor andersoni]|uniref:tigger transposable element-derived protein 4-like n=1 Tax=Dermacentor andersoni TaxID=34620 RepID=UPI003B3A7609
MQEPLYDLIVGNIEGARSPEDTKYETEQYGGKDKTKRGPVVAAITTVHRAPLHHAQVQVQQKRLPKLQAPEVAAEELVLQLGVTDFLCSEGWLTRFKDRNGLVFRIIAGEAAAADATACRDLRAERLPEIMRQFKDDDIYNVDETALFFKLLPTKSMAFKGEKCTGGKLSKERLTVLVGANMSGSDKLKLLVIGKLKNPRCFKGITNMPVTYESNSKAWITRALFNKWLHTEDARFLRQKRRVLFLVDNCPGHGTVIGLKSIQLEFLPANTTALLQPMDQGVIQALKAHFRKGLLQRMLVCMNQNKEYKVDILGAINLIADAWRQLTANTITNFFRHAGFFSSDQASDLQDLPECDGEDALERQEVVEHCALKEIHLDFDEYVHIDGDVVICPENMVESIVAEVCDEESEPEEKSEGVATMEPTTLQGAESAVQYLKNVFLKEPGSEMFVQSLSAMEKTILKMQFQGLKQSKIGAFFGAQ